MASMLGKANLNLQLFRHKCKAHQFQHEGVRGEETLARRLHQHLAKLAARKLQIIVPYLIREGKNSFPAYTQNL